MKANKISYYLCAIFALVIMLIPNMAKAETTLKGDFCIAGVWYSGTISASSITLKDGVAYVYPPWKFTTENGTVISNDHIGIILPYLQPGKIASGSNASAPEFSEVNTQDEMMDFIGNFLSNKIIVDADPSLPYSGKMFTFKGVNLEDFKVKNNINISVSGRTGVVITGNGSINVKIFDILTGETVLIQSADQSITIPTGTFTNERTHYLLQATDSQNKVASMQVIRDGENLLTTVSNIE